MSDTISRPLTARQQAAATELAARDPVIARAVDTIGAPVIRARPGGYAGLFRIIIEQQVSVPSAQAILAHCAAGLQAICPDTILHLGEAPLREVGLSGPKIRYVCAAATAVREGHLDLAGLSALDDDAAMAHLTAITGIGPWTAAIYLLFCDGRLDIWPRGDVALRAAWSAAAKADKPEMKDFDAMAMAYRPARGMAAHILWTYYAHLRGRAPI